jgi:hypothetical protein
VIPGSSSSPVPAPLALPTKAVVMTKEFVVNTVLTRCAAPTTIDLTTVLSQMPGARINMVRIPSNGVMSQPRPTVWVFTPNSNFCALGGNDQLIMQVVDENGNMLVVQRNLSAVQQGDIPSLIRTGYQDRDSGTQTHPKSSTYATLLSWLLVTTFVNVRRKTEDPILE